MKALPEGVRIISFGILVFLTGCSQQTIQSAQEDTQKNVEVVQREAQRAERKLRPEIDKVEKKIQPGLTKAQLGARVYAALKANARLPKTIRVDADTDGVKLRGTVETQEQKELAERVARDTLDTDKTITNDLKVTGE